MKEFEQVIRIRPQEDAFDDVRMEYAKMLKQQLAKGNKDVYKRQSWTSTEKAHYIEMLPIGKYTLREETAPDGYLVAKDVEFEVKDTR